MKAKKSNLFIIIIFGMIGALLAAGIVYYIEILLGFYYVVLFSAGQAFILGGIIYAAILFALFSYVAIYYMAYEGSKEDLVSYGMQEYNLSEGMSKYFVDNYSFGNFLADKLEENSIWMIVELIVILLLTARISLIAVEKLIDGGKKNVI